MPRVARGHEFVPPHPISALCEAQGKRYKDLAEKSGHDAATISLIVHGHAVPRIDTVVDICQELGAKEIVRVLRPWLAPSRARQASNGDRAVVR